MAITFGPRVPSTGQKVGEGFGQSLSEVFETIAHNKSQQYHQRQQQMAAQQQHRQTASEINKVINNPEIADVLARNPGALKDFFAENGYGLAGQQQPMQQANPEQQKQQQFEQMYQARGPQETSLQDLFQNKGFNPEQALKSLTQAPQKIPGMIEGEVVAPKANHSAHILTTIKAPKNKREEKLVDRAEKEQDRLVKQYGKEVSEISHDAEEAETADATLQKQVDLINSGNMPNPTFTAIRESVSHAPKALGAGIGAQFGGPVGAAIGSGLAGQVNLSSLAGTEGNELLSLNVGLYPRATKAFKRLTELEFGKSELGLPLLTDTDEVKIKKINAIAFANARDKIINQNIQKIIEENGGYYERNMVTNAKKRSQKELHQLTKDFRSGKFGYKYEPRTKSIQEDQSFSNVANILRQ